MDACPNLKMSSYSLKCSAKVICGPSGVSQNNVNLSCGLRDVRLLTIIFLTVILYTNSYVQVEEASLYSKSVEIISEFERCGPSEERTYTVWSVVIRCGPSDGRSHIPRFIFLLLYDVLCIIGTYYLVHFGQVKHKTVWWVYYWQSPLYCYWDCYWTPAASWMMLGKAHGCWQQDVPAIEFSVDWWCGGGCNLRPSGNFYAVWRCFSVMAARCALPWHFSGFISCFKFCLYIYLNGGTFIIVYCNVVLFFLGS